MAITLDSSNDGTGGTASSFTYAHNCTGTNLGLFVVIRGGGGEGDRVTGVTYAGAAMTRLQYYNPGGEGIYVYYKIAPATGSNNVVVTCSASSFIQVGSISYRGVNQTTLTEGLTTNTATATSITTNITVSTRNSWTALFSKNASETILAGTGSTLRVNAGSEGARSADSNAPLSTGSQSMQLTAAGSAAWYVIAWAIVPFPEPTSGSIAYFM